MISAQNGCVVESAGLAADQRAEYPTRVFGKDICNQKVDVHHSTSAGVETVNLHLCMENDARGGNNKGACTWCYQRRRA